MTGPVLVHPEAIDQRPKPIGCARKVWPLGRTLVLLVVAWRWVLAPMAALAWLLAAVGLLDPWWVGVVLGLALVGGLSVNGWYRARLRAAGDRTRAIVFRAYWPYLCSFCHFIEIGGRRPRTATLIGVEFGLGNWVRPDWVRLTIEPCTTHLPATWDRYESMLRRHIRYRSSTWTTAPGDPNRMIITCQRRPLPHSITIGTNIDPVEFTPTRADGGVLKPADRILLGVSAVGGRMSWCPDEPGRAMLFIGGRQGGGKGVIAQRVLFYGLATHRTRDAGRWRMRVCDPKAMGEFNWLQPHGVEVSKTPAAMFAMIHEFRSEMERRAQVLDRLGAQNWLDVPVAELAVEGMDGRELLVLDELVTLLTMKGIVPLVDPPKVEGQPKQRPIDPYQVMIGDLQALFAMGRALGMSLVPMTQHPIAEHMGPFGSTMKANLGARIGVGNLEPEGAGSLFGKAHGETIAHRLRAGIPGRCVYQGLATRDGGDWREGQIAYAPVSDLEDYLTGLGHSVPVMEGGG